MLTRGPARKVTIYLNEDTGSTHNFAYAEVFDFLYNNGIAGASLFRPAEGFGAMHRKHQREAQGVIGLHLPVQIQFTDTADKVEALLPALCDLVLDGLIEMQETTIIKAARQEATF